MPPRKPKAAVRRAPPPKTPFTVTIPHADAAEIAGSIHEYVRLEPLVYKEGRKKVVVVDLETMPVDFILQVIRRLPESPAALLAQKMMARPVEDLLATEVSGVHRFSQILQFVTLHPEPFAEMEVGGTWYPVPVTHRFNHEVFGEGLVSLAVVAKAEDFEVARHWYIDSDAFLDASGNRMKRTVREVIAGAGLRITTPERLAAFRIAVTNANKLAQQYGKVVDVTTRLLVPMQIGWRDVLMSVTFGTESSPKVAIVENELEVESDSREEKSYRLPMVRVFVPDLKRYGYVDASAVREHVFDRTAKDRIVLPTRARRVLDAAFDTAPDAVFGDIFHNRHGGIIILAAGTPGVGKTLAAEVYSEYTGRPLYVLELGEIGTTVEALEANLQRVFDRARRWNAVLLLDEADVLLSKRGDDLQKAAVVGVFLRLLDQYEGTFFLTTNRPEVLDPAINSRLAIRLDFPPLDDDRRGQVWDLLLAAAGFTVSADDRGWLAGHDMNGRLARNAVRVLRILYPGERTATRTQMEEALHYIAK